MVLPETLPSIYMQSANSYTDAEVSKLEQRLSEKISNSAASIIAQVEDRLRQQKAELEGIESNINLALVGVSSDIGEMKVTLGEWRIRASTLNTLDMDLREVQSKQILHAEALTTLQSDIYGQPSRGRETIFGMMSSMAHSIGALNEKVGSTSQWIDEEKVRQAEARQRWKNREAAAIAIVKAVNVRAVAGALGIVGTALFVFLKAIGG